MSKPKYTKLAKTVASVLGTALAAIYSGEVKAQDINLIDLPPSDNAIDFLNTKNIKPMPVLKLKSLELGDSEFVASHRSHSSHSSHSSHRSHYSHRSSSII